MTPPSPLENAGSARGYRYADQPLPLRTRFAGMATSFAVCIAVAALGLWQANNPPATISDAPAVTAMTMAPLAAPPAMPSDKPSGKPQEEQESAAKPEQEQAEPIRTPILPPVMPPIQRTAAAPREAAPAASTPAVSMANSSAPAADPAPNASRSSERQQASAPPASSAPPARAASTEQIRWESQILAALNRVKYYPREAARLRQEGVSWICITVDQRGKVRAVRLQKGSGHRVLDQEAIAMASRASPLPRPPAALKMLRIDVIVPIDFSIDQA